MNFTNRPNFPALPVFGVLLLITFIIVFQQLFHAGFVSWDDSLVLLKNKDVHAFDLKSLFTKQYVGNYAPLTMLSFAVDWALFHGNPFYQHAENLLLHYVNGLLIVLLLRRLFPSSMWQPYLVSLIFCFHPLQIETVGWVSAKNNILYTLFFLASLLSYHSYLKDHSHKAYILSLFLFTLSLLSKPSAVVLPLCLFLVDLVHFGKFDVKAIKNKVPFFALSIALGVITIFTRSEAKFLEAALDFSLFERVGFAGYAIFSYVSSLVFPARLSAIYPYPSNVGLAVVTGYIIIAALIFLSIILYRKKLFIILFGLLFFIINLLLVLQILPFGKVLTADRYMYLPIVGISICLFYLLKINVKPAAILAAVLLPLLGILSYNRSAVWTNSITLYEDILDKYPTSAEALSSLGAEYMLRRDYTNALDHLNRAIGSNANFGKAYYNRGLVFAQTNKLNEAVKDFTTAIELTGNIKAVLARGNAYYELNNLKNAVSDGETVIAEEPENEAALFLLARCFDELNNLGPALQYYNRAIILESGNPQYYLRRAILHGKMKRFDQCVQDLDAALSLKPDLGEAHYWMAVAKASQGQDPCPYLRKAVSLGFPPAQNAIASHCR